VAPSLRRLLIAAGTEAPSRTSWSRSSPRPEGVWNTYRECDARCSASHLSLIQPSVLAFTPPGTRILGLITTAISTMTTPTISSIWFDLSGTTATARLYRLDVPRAVLDRTAHETGEAVFFGRPRRAHRGTNVLYGLCTREQRSASPVRTLANTRIRRSHGGITLTETTFESIQEDSMTNQTAVIAVVEPEMRWRDWQARGAANDRRTATRMRLLLLLIVAALVVWFLVQFA